MEFARKQLEKYGWKEGQGLGRKEEGIAKPIKIGIKRDHGGVGLVPGEEFSSHWWTSVFNEAVSNISVDNSGGDVTVGTVSGDEASLSLKQKHYGMHRKSLLYGGFLQSSQNVHLKEMSSCGACHIPPAIQSISDEELLKACGGRTAHKAARHGMKLSGKLKRLHDQEASLEKADTLESLRNSDNYPDYTPPESRQVNSGVKLSEDCSIDVREASSRRKKRRRVGGVGTEPSADGTELHVLEKQCPEYKAMKRGPMRHPEKLKHNRFTVHAGTAVREVAAKKKGKRRKYGSTETVQ